MVKKRVHELAKEMEMSSKDLLNKLLDIGLPVKNHMSTIPSEEVKRIKGMVLKFDAKEKETSKEKKNQPGKNKEQVKKIDAKEDIEEKYGSLVEGSNKNKAKSSKPKRAGDANQKGFAKSKNNKKHKANKAKDNKVKETPPEVKRHIVLTDSIRVQDLAHQLGKKYRSYKKLMQLGTMATINQELILR